MNHSSQIRMTNDEIRKNDEIRMTKPANAPLRVFRHSGFGFLASFNYLCNSGSWSQCIPKNERGLSVNRPVIESYPGWERGAEDARTPDASRQPGVSELREASGVRPIYRRFPCGAGRPEVHGPNACGKNERGLSMN